MSVLTCLSRTICMFPHCLKGVLLFCCVVVMLISVQLLTWNRASTGVIQFKGTVPDTQRSYIEQIILRLPVPKRERHTLLTDLRHGDVSHGELLELWSKHNVNLELDPSLQAAMDGYKKRLPDAIIIGCRKCGTTFFKRILGYHPYIAIRPDEVGYLPFDKDLDRPKEEHRKEMIRSFSDQITMEKNPKYWRYGSPAFLKSYLPNVKLVLLVRDPVCRLASDFNDYQRDGLIDPNVHFDQLVLNDRGDFKEEQGFLLSSAMYDENMKQWLQYFPLEQFKIIKNEDLLTDKLTSILYDMETFLDIPHAFQIEQNATATCVHRWPDDKTHCSPVLKHHECSYEKHFRDLFTRLRQDFKPHVKRFEAMVGRQFNWF